MTAPALITFWPSLTDTHGTRRTLEWSALYDRLSHPEKCRSKKDLPGWSPAHFRSDTRKRDLCESVCALVLDYDDGTTPDVVAATWAEYAGFIYTTPSHCVETDSNPEGLARCRGVLPLRRVVTPAEYDKLIAWAGARARSAHQRIDGGAKDPSRLWFLPGVIGDAPFETRTLDGTPLDPDAILASLPPDEPRKPYVAGNNGTAMHDADRGSAYTNAALRRAGEAVAAATTGTRNDTLNREAFSIAQLVASGALSESRAVDELTAAALHCGLKAREIAQTLRSAFGAGEKSPRAVPEPRYARRQETPPPADDAPLGDEPPGADTPPPEDPPAADDVPAIVVDTNEHRVVEETIAAVRTCPSLYQRGGVLVHAVVDSAPLAGIVRAAGSPRISILAIAGLRERAVTVARFVKMVETKHGTMCAPIHPPGWIFDELQARCGWTGIPVLESICEAPMLRPDGSALTQPGYDAATGLLYIPNGDFADAPDFVSPNDATEALRALHDLVADFPFCTPAHRAAWIASIITPFARFAFRGPSPLTLIDANVRGAGKSLLADITSEIVAGRPMPRMAPAQDDAEERKRITTLVMSGTNLVLIDNIVGSLGSQSLDAALTATTWRDRILGKNADVELPVLITWYATGNNVALVGDMSRRVLHVRLESPLESPETRAEFVHPDILAHVRDNRRGYVLAALTILRAYCAAGRPEQSIPRWGSFDAWSRLVRHAIVWAGDADPGETREALRDEADSAASGLVDLVIGWEHLCAVRGGPCTAAVAIATLADTEADQHPALRSALAELCAVLPGKLPTARQLGTVLKAYRGRVVAGRAIERHKEATRAAAGALWKIKRMKFDADDTSL